MTDCRLFLGIWMGWRVSKLKVLMSGSLAVAFFFSLALILQQIDYFDVSLLIKDILLSIELNANPKLRRYRYEEYSLLSSRGEASCYTDFSGAL